MGFPVRTTEGEIIDAVEKMHEFDGDLIIIDSEGNKWIRRRAQDDMLAVEPYEVAEPEAAPNEAPAMHDADLGDED